MAKKKNVINGKKWHRKTFDNKTSFAILTFVVFCYLVILISYTIFSFNNSIYGSKSLPQIISWDLLGIYNNFIPSPTTYPLKSPPTPIIIPSPTEHPTQKKDYVSNRLGIRFQYISFSPAPESKIGGDYTFIREINNTIYIYWIPGTNQPFSGSDADFLSSELPNSRFVEVFYKDPNLSLTDAIKQKIFGGNIPSQCYISTDKRYGEPNINTSYQQAVILEYQLIKC